MDKIVLALMALTLVGCSDKSRFEYVCRQLADVKAGPDNWSESKGAIERMDRCLNKAHGAKEYRKCEFEQSWLSLEEHRIRQASWNRFYAECQAELGLSF
jgi:hypothetical protein